MHGRDCVEEVVNGDMLSLSGVSLDSGDGLAFTPCELK